MLAREFLLFSFAFSSVVSSAELILPSRPADTKTVRVSRLADNTEGSTPSPLDHGLEKRAIEVGEKEQEGGSQNSLYDGGSEDLSKRNRMGFTGMRGKKEMDPPRRYDSDSYGKRALRNYKELLGGKRAPLAFHGMRGKKSGDYDSDWLEPEYFNLVIPSRRLFDDGNDILEYPEVGVHRDEDAFGEEPVVSKRSPYSFQGMRGKKTSDYDLKRAMGFLGMRGKKSIEVWNPEDYKRAPQSAFFGMKGKKAQSGFFGMRGKKPSWMPWYDFQGIPAGALGKDYQGISFLDHLRDDESSSTRLRRGSPWLYNDKKAKNAFFGVKGKKSTVESSFPIFTEPDE